LTGVELIAAERKRQIEKEGWTAEHDDDEHDGGGLARAAACYAIADNKNAIVGKNAVNIDLVKLMWPWDWKWWNPKKRKRNLVRAGALIAAELDRLLRLEEKNERG